MNTILKSLGLLVGLPAGAIALFYMWASAGHYDTAQYAEIVDYASLPAPEPQAQYTLVSYNIGYLSGLTNNTAVKPVRSLFDANQQQAIAGLQSVQPDIIGLQEVDFGSQRSYQVNQAQVVAQALNLETGAIAINWNKNYVPFPYWPPSAHFGKMLSGQAVLSRYPILENRRLVLEKVASKPFFYNAFYLDRLAQVSTIQLGEQTLVVINIHLEAFDTPTRLNQTSFVRAMAEDYAATYPVVVIGDFNSALNRPEEGEFSIEQMAESELFEAATGRDRWGTATATYPADAPQYKLDYMFYTPETLEVLEVKVVNEVKTASDHLPVMMQFRFK